MIDPRDVLREDMEQDLEYIKARARALLESANAAGVVVTIEQKSFPPLAMGRYIDVLTVRPKRGTPLYNLRMEESFRENK